MQARPFRMGGGYRYSQKPDRTFYPHASRLQCDISGHYSHLPLTALVLLYPYESSFVHMFSGILAEQSCL